MLLTHIQNVACGIPDTAIWWHLSRNAAQKPRGRLPMIALLVVTAAAANIALVIAMADRLTPASDATLAGGRFDPAESGAAFAAKLAA